MPNRKQLFSLFMGVSALVACTAASPMSTPGTAAQNTSGQPAPSLAQPAAEPDLSGIERISAADLQAAMARNEVVVVDVRGEVPYKSGHIKGSIVMPSGDMETALKQLPQGKRIVTYCA